MTVSAQDLETALTGTALQPVYQRIVSLADGATVGFEALARWPTLAEADPLSVFAHATAIGELDALERSCIDAAIRTALDCGIRRGTMLAINCEPASRHVSPADDEVLARGHDELELMFELTERSLLAHPRALLAKVAALRLDGFAIALDDVGSNPDSLALLDIVDPDVIKLDMCLVQSQPDREQARTLAAVLAHQERTDALIIAEGIETAEHLEQALALGASMGQGYRFGRPGPLDDLATTEWRRSTKIPHRLATTDSPFRQLVDGLRVRTARKETLMAFSSHIEDQAIRSADPPMVLCALQNERHFSTAVYERYRQLAHRSPLVAIFGQDMPPELGDGIRSVRLDPADQLCQEWIVLALGAHYAAALIARERDPSEPLQPEANRRFDFAMTYDRAYVTAAAQHLLTRMP